MPPKRGHAYGRQLAEATARKSARKYVQWWCLKNALRQTKDVTVQGITVSCRKEVFCPDPEMTHLPIQMMQMMPDLSGKRVLDLGTGTGILSLYAASKGAEEVVAVDIDQHALANARENVTRHGMQHVISVRESDMFDAVSGKFDLIIANLPILDSFWNDKTGPVADIYQRFIDELQGRLNPGGIALLGFASFGDMNAVKELILPSRNLKTQSHEQKFGVDWFVFQFEQRNVVTRAAAAHVPEEMAAYA
jgi:release factor glutamine methyltransferase